MNGDDCTWSVSAFCSKSGLTGIKAYASKSDLTTPVSNGATITDSGKASNDFYNVESTWYFSGIDNTGGKDYGDLKFYA